MRLRAAIVILGIIAFGVVSVLAFGVFETRSNFRPQARQVFELIRDGKAEQVYEEASSHFKQTVREDSFLDMVDRMTQTLGGFKEIIAVTEVERTESRAGKAVRVVLQVEFEEATTTAELSFLQADRVWRLLGFQVQIPDDLAAKAAALESEHKRIKAPGEVVELVGRIMASVRAGQASKVYAAAAPQFRESIGEDKFETLLRSQQAALGDFVRLLAIISSAQNSEKNRARVSALLEYEKSKTTGTFQFIKTDNAWKLVGFKVIIPEPLLPAH